MNKLLSTTVLALIMLSAPVFAKQEQDLRIYGSLSAQQTVRENLQRRNAAVERQLYRKAALNREIVRPHRDYINVPSRTRVIYNTNTAIRFIGRDLLGCQ